MTEVTILRYQDWASSEALARSATSSIHGGISMTIQATSDIPHVETPAPGAGPRRFDDPLFDRFPISGEHTLSCGLVCHSPFFVPDAVAWMIFGTADLATVRALMRDEDYVPVATTTNRAIACLWLSDFKDSTAGPYTELTVTFIVSRDTLVVPWKNDLTSVAAQLRPDTLVCEHVLLLDNQAAIDYGRELHGFDKHPGRLTFEDVAVDGKPMARVIVTENDRLVLEASLCYGAGVASRLSALAGLIRAFGLLRTVGEVVKAVHKTPVVTPRTVASHRTDIYFRGTPLLRRFGRTDRLRFGSESPVGILLTRIGFEPLAVQTLSGVQGIMPLPLDSVPSRA